MQPYHERHKQCNSSLSKSALTLPSSGPAYGGPLKSNVRPLIQSAMQNPQADSALLSPRSLFVSALFVLLPVYFYVAGTGTTGRPMLVYQGLFYFSIALFFFTANRLSSSVGASAALRWLCESFATFGSGYRTRFFGTLALLAFLAVAFELVAGIKFTRFVSSLLTA